MSLLTPDSGLLFWMLLSFGIVFFVLAKFGFPVITRVLDDRKQYIENALEAAKGARLQLESVQAGSAKILAEAKKRETQLLKEGADMRNRLIEEAKHQAREEADKMIREARLQIQKEKENALKDVRNQVAVLSIEIAEKVLRKNLDNRQAQLELVNKLLDETTTNK